MPTDTDQFVRLNSRIGEGSVLSLGTGDVCHDLDSPEGDALGACIGDIGVLDDGERWLCLLYSTGSERSEDTSATAEFNNNYNKNPLKQQEPPKRRPGV